MPGHEIASNHSNEKRVVLERAINKAKSDPSLVVNEKEVVARYGQIFNQQNLDKLTPDEFKSFLHFENNKHWKNIHRHEKKIVSNMDRLRSVLRDFLDESKPIKHRLDAVLPNEKPVIKGLGKSALTPILLVAYPKRYAVLNEITIQALGYLGMYPVFRSHQTIGERYQKINEIIINVASKNGLSLWQIDWVWYYIIEDKRIKKNVELSTGIHHEVNKDSVYQRIREECKSRNLSFEPFSEIYGHQLEYGFTISSRMSKRKTFGNILGSTMTGQIWQGITKPLYDFYDSNKSENFVVIVDIPQNNHLTLPFEVLRPVIYEQKSGTDINMNFKIRRNPYQLTKNKFPLSQYMNNLNSLFSGFEAYEPSAGAYWIFVVKDHRELQLSSLDVLKIRKADNFWGLSKNTPNRDKIKEGDKVIFSDGAKFIGSATLDSDFYELTNEESEKMSHDKFTTQYGVKLKNVEIWEQPKPIEKYVKALSFIHKKEQYKYYFQGGIRSITKEDFEAVTGSSDSSTATYTNELENIDSLSEQPSIRLKTFEDEGLPEPTPEDISSGYQQITSKLLIPEEKILEIVAALVSGRHILLAGPIGTGKTQLAKMIPEILWQRVGGYFAEEHTATSDWSTQDVIGGIIPKMENGNLIYELQYGCAVDTVKKNWQKALEGGLRVEYESPSTNSICYRGVWLLIDEFNRADIDKAFGQLLTGLRTRQIKIPSDKVGYSYRSIKIPKDYRIIGTLNTADKHFLFRLSDALKSRFAYIEVDIPSNREREKEIYYAMNNAILELGISNHQLLVTLDHANRKLDEGKSKQDFYTRAYQAYYFLDAVRQFKKLGTAILQLIYQNMLTITRLTGDTLVALDNSLCSTIIPQLEGLPQAEIGTVGAMYDNRLVPYFISAYQDPYRQNYSKSLRSTLIYLQVQEQERERFLAEFVNGTIKVKDGSDPNVSGRWNSLQGAYEHIKDRIEFNLTLLKSAITDLQESAAF